MSDTLERRILANQKVLAAALLEILRTIHSIKYGGCSFPSNDTEELWKKVRKISEDKR